MYIDSSSNDSIVKNLDSFLTTLDSIDSDIKGFIKLTDSTSLKFVLFQISDVTNRTNWWKVDLTLQNHSPLFPEFDNEENIKVSIVTNGTRGDRGPQGYQGYTRFQDFRVTPVFQGFTGAQGYTGFQELEVIQVSRVLLDFKEKKEKEYQSTKIQMFLLII